MKIYPKNQKQRIKNLKGKEKYIQGPNNNAILALEDK